MKKKNKVTLFSKIWKYGKRGCTQREKYLDLPDGINVTDDCVCAQICAFKDTNEVMVYNLHYPDDEVNNWGEFMYLHELPMTCLKAVVAVIDNLGKQTAPKYNPLGNYNPLSDIEALAELKRKLEEDDD